MPDRCATETPSLDHEVCEVCGGPLLGDEIVRAVHHVCFEIWDNQRRYEGEDDE